MECDRFDLCHSPVSPTTRSLVKLVQARSYGYGSLTGTTESATWL